MERLSVQSKTTPALFVSAKPNEIQGREGIRTIWPNLLDDRSNLANTFKKTLVQALCKGDIPRLFPPLWRWIFIITLSSSSCRWGTPSAGCLGYLCSQCSKWKIISWCICFCCYKKIIAMIFNTLKCWYSFCLVKFSPAIFRYFTYHFEAVCGSKGRDI